MNAMRQRLRDFARQPLVSASLVVASLVAASLGTVAQAHAEPQAIEGTKGMVVAAHPIASEVGVAALEAGGNAVDAAVATAFALAVVEPHSSGLGGGGFALWLAAGETSPQALDFRETAPKFASRDMFLRDGKAEPALSQTGALSVATPGLVAGLWALHQRGGKRPWRTLVEPAAALARDGFAVYPLLHERIRGAIPRFNEAAQAVFVHDGTAPPVGATLRQPDLARTLDAIATDGLAGFYAGEVAAAIARACQTGGSELSTDDLAAFQPKWRDPISVRYRGIDIFSMPPPSSGGIHLAQMLKLLEGYPLGEAGFGSARATHWLVEAMKHAYADRAKYLGDADFVSVPAEMLLSKERIAAWRSAIREDRARPIAEVGAAALAPVEGSHTTHLSVVDQAGSAVSATLTINLSFGSGWVAEGTGIVLNDEMDDFSAAPGSPNAFGLVGGEANAIAAGKRPLSSMTPTIAVRNGSVFAVVGASGGSRIITTVLQILLNIIDFRMDPATAMRAPRIHHQWKPEFVFTESLALTPDTRAMLTSKGHSLRDAGPICNAQLLVVGSVEPEGQSAARYGASDWRGAGEARAQR